ncbi:hypothetical protein E6O75_ATG06360 [Venturia nashicola]|uniref:Uncharacterized protein n=1 Tax=Venturia nashicola TaxID=86259 RepID=A0A4Z1P832_9PEZI|nr:hypothetical protein E6O75_ATG06360 [Venturia nashicola]
MDTSKPVNLDPNKLCEDMAKAHFRGRRANQPPVPSRLLFTASPSAPTEFPASISLVDIPRRYPSPISLLDILPRYPSPISLLDINVHAQPVLMPHSRQLINQPAISLFFLQSPDPSLAWALPLPVRLLRLSIPNLLLEAQSPKPYTPAPHQQLLLQTFAPNTNLNLCTVQSRQS